MATERMTTTAHRLYLTTFWPLLAIAVVVPGYLLVVHVRDRYVVRRDFACFQRELAKDDLERHVPIGSIVSADPDLPEPQRSQATRLLYTPSAVARCKTGLIVKDAGSAFTRISDPESSILDAEEREALSAALLSVAPLVALVGGRRWIRWLTSPPGPAKRE